MCMIHTMSSAQLLRRLQRGGWVKVHHKGSHVKSRHPVRNGIVVVPHPRKNLPTGTMRAIFRQVGWS